MSGELKITKGLLDKIVNVHAKSTEMFNDIEEQNKNNREEDLIERRNKALKNMNATANNGTTSSSNGTKMKG